MRPLTILFLKTVIVGLALMPGISERSRPRSFVPQRDPLSNRRACRGSPANPRTPPARGPTPSK